MHVTRHVRPQSKIVGLCPSSRLLLSTVMDGTLFGTRYPSAVPTAATMRDILMPS
jgi:hypothetical protein